MSTDRSPSIDRAKATGENAALRGIPYDANPFPADTAEHTAWSAGHNVERLRRLANRKAGEA